MADALNNIIDLNIAIQENNLEKAKTLVTELNTQIDNLKERFEIPEDQDICDYFNLLLIFDQYRNDTCDYVINNFDGVNPKLVKTYNWSKIIVELFDNPSKEKVNKFLDENFKLTVIEDYQISAIIRAINYTQRYDLFKILKEKCAK